jgi:hypothetical protein
MMLLEGAAIETPAALRRGNDPARRWV